MALVMPSAGPRCRAAALSLLFALAALARTDDSLAQPVYDEYGPEYGCASDCECEPGYATSYCEPHCGEPGFGGLWFGAEYLRWRIEGGDRLPPLVTAAPANSTANVPGALGNPDTQILYGNETVGEDWRSGFRLYGGVWLDCCQCWSIGADYFNTDNDDFFITDPNADGFVTRPFFDTEAGTNDAQDVIDPGEVEGTVSVATSDDLSGGGIALQRCVWQCCDPCGCGPSSQFLVLGGYRHYRYDSDLVITEDLLITSANAFPGAIVGTTIFLQDRFFTENEFHGGEAGFQGLMQKSSWWVDGLFKVAVGSHRRVVTIEGETFVDVPPPNDTARLEGGLLAQRTNIGRYADNTIAVIPELRVGLGCQLTCNVSVRAGYGAILWNAVARAGSQLPPGLEVDPRNIPPVDPANPGGPEPAFDGIAGDPLVAHGFDFGIQFTY